MLQQENAKAYVLQLSSQPPSTAVQIERRVDALLQHLPYGTRMNDAVIGALTEIVYVPAFDIRFEQNNNQGLVTGEGR